MRSVDPVTTRCQWEPEELTNQGFEIVGSPNGLHAASNAEHTVYSYEAVQVRAPLRSNWFEPQMNLNTTGWTQLLWTFSQEPNFEGRADEKVTDRAVDDSNLMKRELPSIRH